MSITGLREQTVHGAKSIAEACERRRWNIPTNYMREREIQRMAAARTAR